jgi:hypothetical protein
MLPVVARDWRSDCRAGVTFQVDQTGEPLGIQVVPTGAYDEIIALHRRSRE